MPKFTRLARWMRAIDRAMTALMPRWRSQRRVFAAGALTIVFASHDDAVASRFGDGAGALHEIRVHAHEHVLGNGRDIGAQGEDFAPAGMMWSVVMLSPRRITTLASSTSPDASRRGNFSSATMFGPRRTSTPSPFSGGNTNRCRMDGGSAGSSGLAGGVPPCGGIGELAVQGGRRRSEG